jgi:Outer membrane protein beta-barrel domain
MKKLLVAALALVGVMQQSNAQKGSILVGGSIGIGTAKSPSTPNDSKQTQFNFSPTVGYQFDDNWTAGITGSVQTSKYTNSLNVDSKSSTAGAGPFVRYSKTLSNIFSVYGQLQGTFGSSKTNGTKNYSFSNVNAFPAVFINVKNGFGLNFDFGGISYSSNKPTGGKASNAFSLSFGQSANIGISKNFSVKKK